MDITQSIELMDIIQTVGLLIIAAVGWSVRILMKRISDIDANLDRFRGEIKDELRDYVQQETCRARCDAVTRDIERLHAVHGVCRVTEHGVAVVDINNPAQMRDLRNLMSSDQRHAHTASCQFKEDM